MNPHPTILIVKMDGEFFNLASISYKRDLSNLIHFFIIKSVYLLCRKIGYDNLYFYNQDLCYYYFKDFEKVLL